jgi:hypothetical protein
VKQQQAQFATGKHPSAPATTTTATTPAAPERTAPKRAIFAKGTALPERTAKASAHHGHHLDGVPAMAMAATIAVPTSFDSHVFISFHDASKIYLNATLTSGQVQFFSARPISVTNG